MRLLFVKMPSPAEVELAGAVGFDGIILDTEHGTADGLEHHLRSADAAGVAALVRVPNADPAPILRALDAGAAGVVVAHVSDAEAARAVVDAAHYPPRGHRGLALTTRAGHYGTARLSDHLERAERETVVVVQIEDAEAVARAEEIAAVEGVDLILIGATDLSISLGHPGATDHPEVAAAVRSITAAARARGAAVATVVSSAKQADEAAVEGIAAAVFVSTLLTRDAFSAVAGHRASVRPRVPREPLILLPGLLGTAALWDHVAPALREHVPVQLGRIDLDTSVEEMAESVLAAAPERFSLAGHSLGAIVALAVVRMAPERVVRLALLNSSADPPTSNQLAAWDELERIAVEGDFTKLIDDFASGSVSPARKQEQQLLQAIAAMGRACGPRTLMRQLAAQRSRPDARPALAAIRAPTLVISGADDLMSPPARQDELAAAIPGARLERLVGVGHCSPLEAPAEVASALTAWIT